jgi:hypothetical protein
MFILSIIVEETLIPDRNNGVSGNAIIDSACIGLEQAGKLIREFFAD